ncbi:ethylene-responsive transcription factor ERF020-like [Zingiber officinale]|nr:ethylene-responsive transcription factor ERF020-like [Zingiber officinale]
MSNAAAGHLDEKSYKGVRRRKWGKWVSEIRVPGTGDRLWLGSYTTPEAAAVAHDTALFFFRGPSSSLLGRRLNFPDQIAQHTWAPLSPLSVQRAASNRGMMVDAQLAVGVPQQSRSPESDERDDRRRQRTSLGEAATSEEAAMLEELNVDDMEIWE